MFFKTFLESYLEDPVELPVRPVDLVLEDGERVRVQQVVTVGDYLEPTKLNVAQTIYFLHFCPLHIIHSVIH